MTSDSSVQAHHVEFAITLADTARGMIEQNKRDQLGVSVKPDRSLVTAMDMAIEKELRAMINARFPDHGIIGLANVLGFTLRGLPTDREGILPDAFEAACAVGDVSALVIIPSLGNPTSHVMRAERRHAIADIARRHGIFVIEDEVYKPMLRDPLPSMTDLLPELGFFVTSFTKSVMTGLRTGYLVVPGHYSIRAASILRVTAWSATNVVAEMASRWVMDGTAEALIAIQRSEAEARQAIVSAVLAPFVAGSHPLSLCAWLSVPERWTEEGLVRALARKGVAVTPSDPFVSGGERPAGGIRICLGGRLSHPALRSALETVRGVFEQLPPVFDVGSIV